MKKSEQAEKTKAAIVEAAAQLVHRNGFRDTSLDDIISSIGLTKGAFFHHFSSKKELGTAIIEHWRKKLYEEWIKPLESSKDPLTDLYTIPKKIYEKYTMKDIANGCPLANLATEMSPIDDDMRLSVLEIYKMLEEGIENALKKGQQTGRVKADVDIAHFARFYIDVWAGTRSVSKNTLDGKRINDTMSLLRDYMETLRPVPPETGQ
jgi:AcrR family transcriptional regulator